MSVQNQRIIVHPLTSVTAAEGEVARVLLEHLRSIVADTFEVVGWLRRDDSGAMLYLARQLGGSALVGLRVRSVGIDAEGNEQFSVSLLSEFRPQDIALGGRCEKCGAELTGWERFCAGCGTAVPIIEESDIGSLNELLFRVCDLTKGQYEILGEVPRRPGAGIVYFARELASGRLAALRLSKAGKDPDGRPVLSLASTALITPEIVSPNSGPLGGLGGNFALPLVEEDPPPDALIGTIVDSRYRILRKLGEGGMGSVYLGEHVEMRRAAAIKLMKAGHGLTDEGLARFKREAMNAASIHNEHVAAIYDFNRLPDDTYYIAMEYVPGTDLKKLLARKTRLTPHEAALVARQIADALAAAQSARPAIVHRDLKPENIMIADESPLTVKVVDFGIAKAIDQRATSAQQVTKFGVIGTLAYMSPEQFSEGQVDGRSDIYSLGCVMFEMLTGKIAFSGRNEIAVMAAKAEQRTRPLRQVTPGVPVALERIVAKAMARDPGRRFQTAKELQEALDQFLAGSPQRRAGFDFRYAIATSVLVFAAAGALIWWPSRRSPSASSVSNAASSLHTDARHLTRQAADTHRGATPSSSLVKEQETAVAPVQKRREIVLDSLRSSPRADSSGPSSGVETPESDIAVLRGDIFAARAALEDGRWPDLTTRIDQASSKAAILRQRYPRSARLAALYDEFQRLRDSARTACRSVQEANIYFGKCP